VQRRVAIEPLDHEVDQALERAAFGIERERPIVVA
jgi:hypothetical protein